jgi:hypothetical protein
MFQEIKVKSKSREGRDIFSVNTDVNENTFMAFGYN